MKFVVALGLAALASVAFAALSDINIGVGQKTDISADMWENYTLLPKLNITKRVSIFVKTDSPYSSIQIHAIRREPFFNEEEGVYLCPQTSSTPCPNISSPVVKFGGALTPPGYFFYLYYRGSNADKIPNITVNICDENCTDECPAECGGHGGCIAALGVCICDDGYHNSGTNCKGDGWDWFYWFILIGAVVVFVLIVLLIVTIILCCCCCRKGCCWCCKN